MKRHLLFAGVLVLAGCGEAEVPRDANGVAVPAGEIPPGRYGNVTRDAATGAMTGLEIYLPQGSRSRFAELVRCEEQCGAMLRLAVQPGMGGVSIAVPNGDAASIIALQPSPTGISATADWPSGMMVYDLRRLDRPDALAARREAADAPEAPPAAATPPPLPQP